MLEVWLARTDAADLADCERTATPAQRARADRFVREADRRDYLVAHALARTAIAGRVVCHSLSHARGLAMCAVADAPVGADVERIDAAIELTALAPRLAPDERAGLDVERFFTLWTLKEAYAKARGRGLALAFDAFTVDVAGDAATVRGEPAWRLRSFAPQPGYRAAVAWRT